MPNPAPTIEFGPATLDDLMRVEGKAELIAGWVVRYEPQGFRPARVTFRLAISLHDHGKATGDGLAMTRSLVYALQPLLANGRASISPDASFYRGPLPANSMGPVLGPPTFAAEVRGLDDFGPSVEPARSAKRADYFEAGTLVVWDVDPEARMIATYSDGDPATPTATFRPGDVADAEPAVPGWRLAVAELFST